MKKFFNSFIFFVLILFLGLTIFPLIFALFGLFYKQTAIVSTIIAASTAAYVLKRTYQSIEYTNELEYSRSWTIVFVSLTIAILSAFFSSQTVFGGRDQGAIATAAINLTKFHRFEFSTMESNDLFEKYGPGRALNYPGFDFTKTGELISRFPKGYISYLALFYSLGGIKGLRLANLLPLFLFFIHFYFILKQFLKAKEAFWGFFISASFFSFSWFSKYTLTETSFMAFLWIGIYYLILYFKEEEKKDFFSAIISLFCASITRIEGLVVMALLFGLYLLFEKNKSGVKNIKKIKAVLIFWAIAILIATLINHNVILDSTKNLIKVFIPHFSKGSRPSTGLYLYLWRIFITYNILPYLIIGLGGLFFFILEFMKKKRETMLPLFLPLPAFFYLLTPVISLDDPWSLRRFSFAVLPALIFFSVWAISNLKKEVALLTFAALFISNIPSFLYFIQLSENSELLPQVEKLSQKFSPHDLILVDRLASGSGFSLISDPLASIYGKNALYFFNANDLKVIDASRYENIYLISPMTYPTWHSDLKKEKIEEFSLINSYLLPSNAVFSFAEIARSKTVNGIYKVFP